MKNSALLLTTILSLTATGALAANTQNVNINDPLLNKTIVQTGDNNTVNATYNGTKNLLNIEQAGQGNTNTISGYIISLPTAAPTINGSEIRSNIQGNNNSSTVKFAGQTGGFDVLERPSLKETINGDSNTTNTTFIGSGASGTVTTINGNGNNVASSITSAGINTLKVKGSGNNVTANNYKTDIYASVEGNANSVDAASTNAYQVDAHSVSISQTGDLNKVKVVNGATIVQKGNSNQIDANQFAVGFNPTAINQQGNGNKSKVSISNRNGFAGANNSVTHNVSGNGNNVTSSFDGLFMGGGRAVLNGNKETTNVTLDNNTVTTALTSVNNTVSNTVNGTGNVLSSGIGTNNVNLNNNIQGNNNRVATTVNGLPVTTASSADITQSVKGNGNVINATHASITGKAIAKTTLNGNMNKVAVLSQGDRGIRTTFDVTGDKNDLTAVQNPTNKASFNDTITATVKGASNIVDSRQHGDRNSTTVAIIGSGNNFGSYQEGNDDIIVADINGGSNTLGLIQNAGNNNKIDTTITGNLNTYNVTQMGGNNSVISTTKGDKNTLTIIQNGSNNKLTSDVKANNNDLYLRQQGDGNKLDFVSNRNGYVYEITQRR